jgi:hypothetical protein
MKSTPPAIDPQAQAARRPDWQVVGWMGYRLEIPAAWNLSSYYGGMKSGEVYFSDLVGRCLHLAWQSPPPKRLARTAETMQTQWREQGWEFSALGDKQLARHKEQTRVLWVGTKRIVTLEWLLRSDWVPEITASLQEEYEAPEWLWQIYGVAGMVPREIGLERADFIPGGSSLCMTDGWTRLWLGSVSLAEQRIGRDSAGGWASTQVLAKGLRKLPWSVAGDHWHVAQTMGWPLFPWGQRQTGILRHDTAANVLRWSLLNRWQWLRKN